MESGLMHLKILLPFKIFMEVENVTNIVAETDTGQYGFLPHRLDCVAALVPGIFMYETATGGAKYIAIDKGILVKAGTEVLVSVRNAIGGVDLGKLHDAVKKEFSQLDDNAKNVRNAMEKMENSFMLQLQKFKQQ